MNSYVWTSPPLLSSKLLGAEAKSEHFRTPPRVERPFCGPGLATTFPPQTGMTLQGDTFRRSKGIALELHRFFKFVIAAESSKREVEGNVDISQRNVDISFQTKFGKLSGKLCSNNKTPVARSLARVRAPSFALGLASPHPVSDPSSTVLPVRCARATPTQARLSLREGSIHARLFVGRCPSSLLSLLSKPRLLGPTRS